MAKNFQSRERQNVIRAFIAPVVAAPFVAVPVVAAPVVAAPNVAIPILQFSADLPLQAFLQ
jgi:hypothetical protein